MIWKDSTYLDETDKTIIDFGELLVNQFGSPVNFLDPGNLGIALNMNMLGDFNEIKKTFPSQTIESDLSELEILISRNIYEEVEKAFIQLLGITNPDNALSYIKATEVKIKEYEQNYSDIEKLQEKITESLTAIDSIYQKITVSMYIDKTKAITNSNKILTNRLKTKIETVKNSLKDESLDPTKDGYFRIRKIEFDEGEKFQASLTITEFEYDKEAKDYSKKSDVYNKSIIFQEYNSIAISFSAGLFYSSATLKGFGVSNNEEDFTITEDDITKNDPVRATFLNFHFRTGSKYFAPLAQIGIDPTKKRPFLLLGGGFSIPITKIAFSGGPLWTWDPTLEKLSVGQSITSTTDLEQDIKYKFDMEPKGWYLGIQYNF